jgi:Spy/CpxP family protein refolding chaperone
MRKRLVLISTAAVALLAAAAVVNAQRPGGPGQTGPTPPPAQIMRGGGPGQGRAVGPGRAMARTLLLGRAGRLQALGRRLDLTADQRTKIEDIVRGARDQAAPLVDQLELARKDLHRAAFADKAEASAVTNLTNKVAGLEKQVLEVRVKAETAVSSVLTDKQRETVRIDGRFLAGGPGPMRGGLMLMRGGRGRGRGGPGGASPGGASAGGGTQGTGDAGGSQ